MSCYHVSQEALWDIEEILFHISHHDPMAAHRWYVRMEAQFRVLGEHPLVGVSREDLAPSVRFSPVGNYLIFYRPAEDCVEILRVIHGARDYGPNDFQ